MVKEHPLTKLNLQLSISLLSIFLAKAADNSKGGEELFLYIKKIIRNK